MNNYPLLMTASIDPKGMSNIPNPNIAVREKQYCDTLYFYLASGWIKEIIFVDNSGYDLTKLRNIALKFPGTTVEFMPCDFNNYSRELGKGYGEMRILDYAVDHSELVKAAGGFTKVTGRFPILNIHKVLEEAQRRQPWSIFCDTKDHTVYEMLGLPWRSHSVDTRIFCITSEFYRKYFYGKYVNMNDSVGLIVERLFFETIQEECIHEKCIRRFRTEPEYSGHGNHFPARFIGTNNYGGLFAKTKRRIRQVGRWVVPWFWF